MRLPLSGSACLACILLLPVGVRAASVTNNYSPNYVHVHVHSDGSYVGATVTDSSVTIPPTPGTFDDATAAPPSEPHGPGFARDNVHVNFSYLPTSGMPKDHINASDDLTYFFGDAATSDRFELHFTNDVNTTDARNSAGEPSSAKLNSLAQVEFNIASGFSRGPGPALAPGAPAGSIRVPALDAVDTAFESLLLTVLEDGVPIASSSAGSPAFAVPIRAAHAYRIDAAYKVTVPYGVDPAGTYDLAIAVVPEPTALVLILPGILLLRRAGR